MPHLSSPTLTRREIAKGGRAGDRISNRRVSPLTTALYTHASGEEPFEGIRGMRC